MQYTRFLQQRQPIWDEFERGLEGARRSPRTTGYARIEKIAFLYRQVLHDHALAAARYPGTSAARHLSHLALEGTHWLSRDAGDRLGRPVNFFSRSFPLAFRRNLSSLVWGLFLFVASALFGLTLAAIRPDIGVAFLGPATIEGLRQGHLWTESLVSSVPPAVSSSFIATNNMSVALTGWAGGSLAGLGAVYVLLLNGFMLGAIFGVTASYSMAGALGEFASAHGPLELTLIIVTAAAGLGMGRALVEATDEPRSHALRRAGIDALIILLGCLPWFLLLGAVEGFISPSPQIPRLTKLALGISLEAVFLTIAWNPFLRREEK